MTESFDMKSSGDFKSFNNGNVNGVNNITHNNNNNVANNNKTVKNVNDDNNDNLNYGNKRKIAASGNSSNISSGNLPNNGGGDNTSHRGAISNGNGVSGFGGSNFSSGGSIGSNGAHANSGGNTTSVVSSVGGINNNKNNGGGDHGIQLNDKAIEYMRDCFAEKSRMDKKFPICEKLVDLEIEKVQTTGRIPVPDQKLADIYREKPLRLSQKVLVPIREHPKFNFVGKLLGPKGNSLRRLQEETFCKMTVLGKNSMRDRAKEEELRNSKDPRFAHLNYDLHVEISTIAPPAEAYARIAYAMAELRKYLIPDNNDVIRIEQIREMMDHTGPNNNNSSSNHSYNKNHNGYNDAGGNRSSFKKPYNGGTSVIGPLSSTMSSLSLSNSNSAGGGASGGMLARNIGSNGFRGNHGGGSNSYNKPAPANFAPKQKVMSILEKARTSMDESYGLMNSQGSHNNGGGSYIHGSGSSNARNNFDTYNSGDKGSRRGDYHGSSSSNYTAGGPVGMTSNHNRNNINSFPELSSGLSAKENKPVESPKGSTKSSTVTSATYASITKSKSVLFNFNKK